MNRAGLMTGAPCLALAGCRGAGKPARPAPSAPSTASTSSTASTPLDPRELLPVGTFTVDMMELQPTPQIKEISERLRRGIASHRDWWASYRRQAQPGKPLPYHPN